MLLIRVCGRDGCLVLFAYLHECMVDAIMCVYICGIFVHCWAPGCVLCCVQYVGVNPSLHISAFVCSGAFSQIVQ